MSKQQKENPSIVSETERIPGYASPRGYGDKYLTNLYINECVVQEKIDGSQFSFTKTASGEVLFRSRGGDLNVAAGVDKLFRATVENILAHADHLEPGYIYRGEAMCGKRHNKLEYDRAPLGNLVLFDVQTYPGGYLSHAGITRHAERLGVEPVRQIAIVPAFGKFTEEEFRAVVDGESQLGGKPEGVVVKNYHQPDPACAYKVLMAKIVSEAFSEKKPRAFKTSQDSEVAALIEEFRTEARWHKAVQHLREASALTESAKDIGPLLKEISQDLEREQAEYIKDRLYKAFRKQILSGVGDGFPKWYQQHLAQSLEAAVAS